jgi:hypothetical protein
VIKQSTDPFAVPGFDIKDRRAAIERAEQERAAERNSRIEAQSSPLLTPQERVQRWEDLHGVRLPADPNHKLVRVIALDTALAIEQVRDEQTRRRETTLARHP